MKISSTQITRITFIVAGGLVFFGGMESESIKALADPFTNAPQKIMISSKPNLPDVKSVIRRDPFNGAPVDKDSPNANKSASPGSPGFSAPANIISNVPNAGTIFGGPNIPVFGPGAMQVPNAGSIVPGGGAVASEVTVSATMIGNGKPLALIANGTTTDIVGVGDAIGSRIIRRIVSQGIEFEDGSRVSVVHNSGQSTPTIQNTDALNNNSSIQVDPSQSVPNANQQKNRINGLNQSLPTTTNSNNVPVINPTPYKFGASPTLSPDQTPAPINRLYTPPPTSTNITTPPPALPPFNPSPIKPPGYGN